MSTSSADYYDGEPPRTVQQIREDLAKVTGTRWKERNRPDDLVTNSSVLIDAGDNPDYTGGGYLAKDVPADVAYWLEFAREDMETLLAELEARPPREEPVIEPTTEERRDLIEQAVKSIARCFPNDTAAWNSWNIIASSAPFIRALRMIHGPGLTPSDLRYTKEEEVRARVAVELDSLPNVKVKGEAAIRVSDAKRIVRTGLPDDKVKGDDSLYAKSLSEREGRSKGLQWHGYEHDRFVNVELLRRITNKQIEVVSKVRSSVIKSHAHITGSAAIDEDSYLYGIYFGEAGKVMGAGECVTRIDGVKRVELSHAYAKAVIAEAAFARGRIDARQLAALTLEWQTIKAFVPSDEADRAVFGRREGELQASPAQVRNALAHHVHTLQHYNVTYARDVTKMTDFEIGEYRKALDTIKDLTAILRGKSNGPRPSEVDASLLSRATVESMYRAQRAVFTMQRVKEWGTGRSILSQTEFPVERYQAEADDLLTKAGIFGVSAGNVANAYVLARLAEDGNWAGILTEDQFVALITPWRAFVSALQDEVQE